jgi:2-methylfumaryl-CoA isomerase
LRRLACAPGDDAGILVSNVYGRPWLADELLREHRPDLIHVQVLGWANGDPAVDYVVNAASGLPYVTGPAQLADPVNHVLPAWDLLCGVYVATTVLSGLHRRVNEGVGMHATVSLEDIATATLTTLGLLSETHQAGRPRERIGNAVYGTFGTDVAVADGTVLMIATVTDRQWRELLDVTGLAEAVAAVESAVGADFTDEGDRYRHRGVLVGLLRPWFARRGLAEVSAALATTHVLWSPFRQLTDLVADVAAGRSEVARIVDEGDLGANVVTTGPVRLRGEPPPAAAAAPVLGSDSAR